MLCMHRTLLLCSELPLVVAAGRVIVTLCTGVLALCSPKTGALNGYIIMEDTWVLDFGPIINTVQRWTLSLWSFIAHSDHPDFILKFLLKVEF